MTECDRLCGLRTVCAFVTHRALHAATLDRWRPSRPNHEGTRGHSGHPCRACWGLVRRGCCSVLGAVPAAGEDVSGSPRQGPERGVMAGAAEVLAQSLDVLKQQRDGTSMARFALELVGGGIDDARELLEQALIHLRAPRETAVVKDFAQPAAATSTSSEDTGEKKRPAPDGGAEMQSNTKVARSEVETSAAAHAAAAAASAAEASGSSNDASDEVVDLNYFRMDSFDDSDELLMLLVPDAAVASIIGKAGVTIKKIQSSTGIKIDIQTSAEMVPGQHERRVSLKGSVKNTNIGAYLVGLKVAEKLRAEHAGVDVPVVLKMLVPDHSVSAIIGKQGVSINQIQSQSSARVQIEKSSEMLPGLGGRAVSITGSTRARLLAQYLISRSVSQHLRGAALTAGSRGTTSSDTGLGQESMEIFAQNDLMARLIGKQGKNISEVQSSSGARVQIEKESEMVSTGRSSRKITLVGTQAAVSHCHSIISKQLSEWQAVHGATPGSTSGTAPEQPRATGINYPPPANYAPLAQQQPGALPAHPHPAMLQPAPGTVPAPAPSQSAPVPQAVYYHMPAGYGYTALPGTHPPGMVPPGAAAYSVTQPVYHYPVAQARGQMHQQQPHQHQQHYRQ